MSIGPFYDIIVVGAGIAGSAAAIAFARQGRRVLLLERRLKEPDRIVGELLQPAGAKALEELGLSHCISDIDAIPVRGYHIYWKAEEVTFWYPPFPGADSRAEGRSFHHGRFVSNLRRAAQCESNVTVVEATVTGLVADSLHGTIIGVEALSGEKRSTQYHAPLTIVADGSTSNLRGHFRQEKPRAKSRFWGLELQGVQLPTEELAYGVIGRGPPILIYRIGADETRILIDIPDDTYHWIKGEDSVKSYIRHTVIPTLPEAVQQHVDSALENNRLRSMPNQWFPPKSCAVAGALLLGDASNMRHPLTGGGMAVALRDVVLLSTLLHPQTVSLHDHEAVLNSMRRFYWRRKLYSASLNILAQALYTLFVADGTSSSPRSKYKDVEQANMTI